MPTGYTHRIQTGEMTELRDFAMSCARAFGACVDMRDEPMDAEIPDAFKPGNYHADRLDELRKELADIEAMSAEQAAERAKGECEAEMRRRAEDNRTHLEECDRYRAMREKVLAWQPPTPNHNELRNFMLSQLDDSINLDGPIYERRSPPLIQDGETWKLNKRESLLRSIDFHAAEHKKEIERAKNRTIWVRQLRASLP